MRHRSRRQPRRTAPRRLAGLAVLGLTVLTSADLAQTAPAAPEPAGTIAAASAADQPRAVVLPASPPARLRIPALDVDTADVTDLGLRADRTMDVPDDAGTVGWYTRSPTPGERGPAVLAAHVDWKRRKGVFHDLHRLKPGDQVMVERVDGSVASFAVLRVEQYPKDRFPAKAVYGDVESPELRLITCGGQFDRKARSYRDNIVVYAAMTSGSARPIGRPR